MKKPHQNYMPVIEYWTLVIVACFAPQVLILKVIWQLQTILEAVVPEEKKK